MTKYIHRYIEPHIAALSKAFPVVLVTGARQVGKTTLLQYLSARTPRLKRQYVSMDEFEIRALAKNDPSLFLEQYPPPLIIDEIQYAPQLLPYIKAMVDKHRRMGEYWLTGSQQFHLMRHVSESLAGRVGITNLFGLSFAEENEQSRAKEPWIPSNISKKALKPFNLLEIFKTIIRGSFPRMIQRDAPPLDSFYGSYVQTYIDRDLRDLVKVSSLSSFEKFVRVCAARTANMLNLSDLARDSDISVNTAKEWLSMLEASRQIFLLRPYYKNITKRLIKAPKMYFLDTGLASYLTGWRDPVITAKGAFAGQLFETFVVAEIIKSYAHRGKEPRLFYFRTKEKTEVDILIEKNGTLFPVEIKLAARVQASDLKGMDELKKTNARIGAGAVVAAVKEPYPLRRELIAVPPTMIG